MIELKNEIKTTRITICKYDTYQIDGIKAESKTKRKRNASESDADPNKNEKNEKKKNFQKNLEPYLEKFGADMIEDFFLYWTEETPKGEMRWETMKAFSLGRRLGTWNKNLIQRQSESGADDYQSNVMKQMRGGGHE